MQAINFLCLDARSKDLEVFAQRVFEALAVTDDVERLSSNFAEGRYYAAKFDGCSLTIALSDEAGFDDLPYWLSFRAEDGEDKLALVDTLIKTKLLIDGMNLARIIDNFGRKEMRRVDY